MNWGFGEVLWFRRAEGALAETLKAAAARDTQALQRWLTGRLGSADWFGGGGFGWADAAVAPMLNRSVQYGLGPDVGSPLGRWHARLRERPAVADTFAEFDHVLHFLDHVGPIDRLVQPLPCGEPAEQAGLVLGPGERVVVVGAVRHRSGWKRAARQGRLSPDPRREGRPG